MNKDEVAAAQRLYGESFYTINSKQFAENFINLKNSFCSFYPNFNIAYSYKTNYTPQFCKKADDLGGYAEVVSEMELRLALEIGVNPKKIIWNGPIKSSEYMEKLLISGGIVNIDSIVEMECVKRIAESNPDGHFRLGIRCNFDIGDGVVSRFGVDTSSKEFQNILNLIQATPNITFYNLQCHFANRSLIYWSNRVNEMIDLVRKIGHMPKRVDLGGGLYGNMPLSLKEQFPVAVPSYDDYAQSVGTAFAKAFPENNIELIIEPGSALVGDCMQFVCPVKTIKNVRGKYFASVLGSQKNISMTGVNPPIQILHMGGQTEHYEDIDIVGYTCIESDVIYHHYSGDIAINDVIVIGNCGSYSTVMKPPFILPNFPVIEYSEGNIKLIKQGETFGYIFHTYVF